MSLPTRLHLASMCLLALGAACAGADAPPSAAPATAAPAPDVDPGVEMKSVCVGTLTRQRECTEVFIPALVDLRISLDLPEGIAARAEAEGRDALVQVAMAEWAEDSKPEAIAQTCDSMSSGMPADQLERLADAAKVCLAETDCVAFVDCIIPVIRQSMVPPEFP